MTVIVPERLTLKDNEVVELRHLYSSVLKVAFSADYYLETNPDVRRAQLDPLRHFFNHGFYEGRNPSPGVVLSYCKWLARSRNRKFESPADLLALLDSLTSEDWFGPHPCLSPRWITAQGGWPKSPALPLSEILSKGVPQQGISWHPALARCTGIDPNSSLHEAFATLSDRTILELSLVDLVGYLKNHKDLQVHLSTSEGIHSARVFQHVFSEGLQENRLRFIRASVPRWASLNDIFVTNAVNILLLASQAYLYSSRDPLNVLPRQNTEILNIQSDDMESLLNCKLAPGVSTPDIDILLLFNAVASRKSRVIVGKVTQVERVDGAAPGDQGLSIPSIRTRLELLDRDVMARGLPGPAGIRRVVYSALLDGYDDVPVPPELEDCGYYLVTDLPIDHVPEPWVTIRPTIRERDAKRSCLWYKTHSHRLFANVPQSIWIDANVVCQLGSEKVLLAQESLAEIATFNHPDRQCVYDEATTVKQLRLDDSAVVDSFVARLERSGMPRQYGLYETNVLYLRTSDLAVREFLDHWWNSISHGSRRDQLSFTFSLWSKRMEVSLLDGRRSSKDSKYFHKRPHKSSSGRFI